MGSTDPSFYGTEGRTKTGVEFWRWEITADDAIEDDLLDRASLLGMMHSPYSHPPDHINFFSLTLLVSPPPKKSAVGTDDVSLLLSSSSFRRLAHGKGISITEEYERKVRSGMDERASESDAPSPSPHAVVSVALLRTPRVCKKSVCGSDFASEKKENPPSGRTLFVCLTIRARERRPRKWVRPN